MRTLPSYVDRPLPLQLHRPSRAQFAQFSLLDLSICPPTPRSLQQAFSCAFWPPIAPPTFISLPSFTPPLFSFHSSIIRVVQVLLLEGRRKGIGRRVLQFRNRKARRAVQGAFSVRLNKAGDEASFQAQKHRCARAGGENAEREGRIYKKAGLRKPGFSMSTTGSQGGAGGGAAAAAPPPPSAAVSKRPMSSQKSGRSGSTPGPLKKSTLGNGVSLPRKPSRSVPPGERTVKRLRLSKALTIPDGSTVADACRRMATRRVDAALLVDSSALLCGIITDKDVATRVIAEGLRPEETSVSKVMTKNPVFVMGDTLAVEALQKMVQGKFRHLPVVENGEVVALLDITKCLYDAIARMERAAEKGNAIAAAVESVEREWNNNATEKSSFIENLRDKMFRPTLGSIIQEGTKVATCSASETVTAATRKMKEHRMNSVIITSLSNKPTGILTSKDVLMRVVAQGLSPETTTLDKVMTPNPECAGLDTTLVDALHTMHDGKFLHLPVTDRDGYIVACVDVLQLTHGAVATVGSTGSGGADTATNMLQKFWDSALALEPADEDDDSHSDISARQSDIYSERHSGYPDRQSSYPSFGLGNQFAFKLKVTGRDGKERNHRFNCGSESLTELMSMIVQRVGEDIDRTHLPRLMYVDDEGDKVLLATDSDLVSAVNFARISGWKALTLHLEESQEPRRKKVPAAPKAVPQQAVQTTEGFSGLHTAIIAGSVAVVAVSLVLLFRRSNS